jgi:hypothetical protein
MSHDRMRPNKNRLWKSLTNGHSHVDVQHDLLCLVTFYEDDMYIVFFLRLSFINFAEDWTGGEGFALYNVNQGVILVHSLHHPWGKTKIALRQPLGRFTGQGRTYKYRGQLILPILGLIKHPLRTIQVKGQYQKTFNYSFQSPRDIKCLINNCEFKDF